MDSENWRPEMEVSGVEDVVDVSEPLVGAGKTHYHVGFTSAPITPGGDRAVEGQTYTNQTLLQVQALIDDLSACSAQETALTNAITERDATEDPPSILVSPQLISYSKLRMTLEKKEMNLA